MASNLHCLEYDKDVVSKLPPSIDWVERYISNKIPVSAFSACRLEANFESLVPFFNFLFEVTPSFIAKR